MRSRHNVMTMELDLIAKTAITPWTYHCDLARYLRNRGELGAPSNT